MKEHGNVWEIAQGDKDVALSKAWTSMISSNKSYVVTKDFKPKFFDVVNIYIYIT